MKLFTCFALVFMLSGCASTQTSLSSEESSVVVNRGSYSLIGCKVVGTLKEEVPLYWGSDSYYVDHAGNVFKKAAFKIGANMVVVIKDGSVGDTVIGIAHKCN